MPEAEWRAIQMQMEAETAAVVAFCQSIGSTLLGVICLCLIGAGLARLLKLFRFK